MTNTTTARRILAISLLLALMGCDQSAESNQSANAESPAPVAATQERTPLEEFIDGFPIELEKQTRNASYEELFKGGDVSAYFNVRASEFMNTAMLPSRQPAMPLGHRPMPEIGMVKAETIHDGKMTLDRFLARDDTYSQAYLVVHKGDIVYEKYPRLRPEEAHLWMSCAKPTASLVVDLLISEGKIDENKPITKYLTDWKGTDWDGVTTRDVLDMASGMDLDDTADSRMDPNSIANRLYRAEFNFPSPNTGKVERMADILKSTKAKSKPGLAFEYSSPLTQVLVLLAEAVEGERWQQIFDRRVWSRVGAEGALQLHLSPDGIAAAHGLVSSNLRDFARFGMLYTPSWEKIATEQVVSDEILKHIQQNVRPNEVFMNGAGPRMAEYLGSDDVIGQSRQWDMVWPDGDLWKGGLMTQGLYVSPSRDLVIVYFSVNNDDNSAHRFARPIATSGLFEK
jgi:CubicO group peptidase (beta-lactamase class C family)